jgi:hypothetical protein
MASLLDNGGVGRARPTRAHQHRIAELCQITYYGAIALGGNKAHREEIVNMQLNRDWCWYYWRRDCTNKRPSYRAEDLIACDTGY